MFGIRVAHMLSRIRQEPQVERMRVVHALRNVPASRPGEPHHRSQEQLALLAKLVRNTPELKAFEQEELMQVLGAATYINAVPGHVLCHQGEIGDRFFAIIEGMVSIHVRPKVEVESTLASAAEKKGGGAGLIKAMLAALSHQKAEAWTFLFDNYSSRFACFWQSGSLQICKFKSVLLDSSLYSSTSLACTGIEA